MPRPVSIPTTVALSMIMISVSGGLSLAQGTALVHENPRPVRTHVPPPRAPSTGVGHLVTGGIFLGLGVLNLVTAPICRTDAVEKDMQDPCLFASLGVGGLFVAVGTPLLIIGTSKRRTYKEWRRQHPHLAVLSGLAVGVRKKSMALNWRWIF